MDKVTELKALQVEMARNASLPLRQSNLVFGEGSVNCTVMFIGEAPGANEDRVGRPFVGRGGQLLDEMMRGIGWKRSDVYITNIVKRRPPENRDPLQEEIEAYKPYLARQIAIINPKVIVTLGRFAMNYFLPLAKITKDHGRAFAIDGRTLFPVYHPAAALRATQMKDVLRADFQKLPKIISGESATEVAPAFIADPFEKKKDKNPKQQGLF